MLRARPFTGAGMKLSSKRKVEALETMNLHSIDEEERRDVQYAGPIG